ncbi:phospholipid/cholesterol/gamma-HCH transport system substrate-binding protein [Knoellia remsis]|uniref:Phospholipid/cholesterol/gamma-HCH transport system substrate-binding protein n=1 Tax=Knoellia remsis TaxID=407159 RepID=A0A2T0UHU1_9MICO|nr:MlaD family protein [Knoellia remsis]PRY57511.1 phospholipid/cholesterol/gamma-HCH transport system substrate-binding protein [Knoellia remsis]
MKTSASLVKFIAFAVVTVLATATLAATIANIQPGDRNTYTGIFKDVTGLAKGHEVRIAGVRVGTVKKIAVAKDRTSANVEFDVLDTSVLTEGTIATIKYRNLVGERYISLTQGPGKATPLKDGATIPLERTKPALDLTVLFNGFKPLFAALSPKDVNELSQLIISVLQGEGGNINSLLGQTASLTSSIADRDKVIGRVITNLTTILTTVEQNDTALGELLIQLQRFVSGLAADRKAIGASLTNINSLADETAQLLAAGRPDIKTDVAQLGQLAKNLNKPENTQRYEQFITGAPNKINTITRTATYGSWFNFYLCRFDVENLILPTGPLPGGLGYNVSSARCGKG